MYHNSNIETFANDCSITCLVGDLSPYEINSIIHQIGKQYRQIYNVDTQTLAEMAKEGFENMNDLNNGSDKNENGFIDTDNAYNKLLDQLDLFKLDECFIDTFLYTNLYAQYIDDNTESHNVRIYFDEAGDDKGFDSSLYRLKYKQGDKEGFFEIFDDIDGIRHLRMSKEPLQIMVPVETFSSISTSNYNSNSKSMSGNNSGSGSQNFELQNNPNNKLYFQFFKNFENKLVCHVIDSDGGSYGYIAFKTSVSSGLEGLALAAKSRQSLNFNNNVLIPYEVPDYSLDVFLNSNFKFYSSSTSQYEDVQVKITKYYVKKTDLQFQYQFTFKMGNVSNEEFVFTMDIGSNKLTSKSKCHDSDKLIFTFWNTLDKQFIICKFLENIVPNCYTQPDKMPSAVTNNSVFYVLGMNENKELLKETTFENSLQCSLSNTAFAIEAVRGILETISLMKKTTALTALRDRLAYDGERSIGDMRNLNPNESGKDCNNNYVNFLLFLKIISVVLALFLFIDLNNDRELPVKIFKGIWVAIFSEFYLIYQFFKIVIGNKPPLHERLHF